MTDLLIGAAGGLIVIAVALDIFRSLLVPRASGRMLRVGPVLNAALFSLWHGSADRITRPRVGQTMRASFAPFMLVLMMLIWASLFIFGFGLVFWAERSAFNPAFGSVGDAIYAAGSAFSTLGINGTVSSAPARMTVLVCSVAGLAIVTVVATFLISIQSAFGRRETMVLRLEAHVTLPPAGIAILETYAREEIIERLGAFFEAWELWAAEVAVSHRAFPILIFFRSNDSRCEWLAALGAVLDAASLLNTTVEDVPASAHAGARFLLRTGARVLQDMATQLGAGENPDGPPIDLDRFRTHRDRLKRSGYSIADNEGESLKSFMERRSSYAASLSYLGRRLHIDVDERTGSDEDSKPR